MARTNGGIIGKINHTSFGKCTQTVKTSDGTVTTTPATRLVQALVVAGGGGGGNDMGGAGGAGGLRNVEISVCGNTPYPMAVGGGGAGGSSGNAGTSGVDSVAAFPSNPITSEGGGGGGGNPLAPGSGPKDGADG